MHNTLAIANFHIQKSQIRGLTLLKILKLSYFSHGFTLAILEKPLSNEFLQAWKYGPVFPSIYNKFKHNPNKMIKKLALDVEESTNSVIPISSNFSNEEKKVMNLVHKIYSPLEGWRLSALTHQENTPWHEAYNKENGGKNFRGVTIPNSEIKKHFEKEIIKKYVEKK